MPPEFETHFVDESLGALYFCVDFANGHQGQVTTYGACDPPRTARIDLYAEGARIWHD